MVSTENWENIKDYEGFYQVSDLGKIKSLERLILKQGHLRKTKEKILKLDGYKNRYKLVKLYKNGKYNTFSVARLVGEHFIPNPLNKSEINHIDGDRQNNNVSNLEWVTHKENMAHAKANKLHNTEKTRLMHKKREKPVTMLSMDNEPLLWFDSMQEASGETKTHQGDISSCCYGKRNYANGYKWRFYSERGY